MGERLLHFQLNRNMTFNIIAPGAPPFEIPKDDFGYVAYEVRCNTGCPLNTREVKNYTWVKLSNRDQLFFGSGSWKYPNQ
jgi:hypothetical protein